MKYVVAMCLLLSAPVMAEENPGENLLTFFGSTCTTGNATQSALADSQSLISTLQNLSSDVDCKSVAGSLGSLQQLQHQLYSMQSITGTRADLAEIDAKEQQLLIHLAQTNDARVQAETSAYLRDLQIERAGIIGRNSSQAELNSPAKSQLAINAIYSTQALYSQLTADKKCMAKHPDVLNKATSIVAAVGAGVALINPALGLGLAVGANFVGATVEGARKVAIAKDIRRVSDKSIVLQGVKCALETMSDRYCLNMDTERFMNFKMKSNIRTFDKKPTGKALLLVDRQLPIFLEWLKEIRSGVKPTTTAEASRQSMAIRRDAFLRALEVESIGLINNSQDTYNSYAGSPAKQWNFLRSIVNKLAPGEQRSFGQSTSISDPMNDVKAAGYGPFFLLGLKETDPEIKTPNGYLPLDAYDKKEKIFTLAEVKANYEEWISEAMQLVERERTQVQQPDPQALLHKANDRTAARFNLSPMDSLKDIIAFIEAHPPGVNNASFNMLFKSTLVKLKSIEATTEAAVLLDIQLPSDETDIRASQEDPLQLAVKDIFRTAQLDYGTIVIATRIEMMLAQALYSMLADLPEEDRALVAQFMAATRFSDNLKKGITQTDTVIMTDVAEAKGYMLSNLDAFTEIFQKNINKLLATLEFEERTAIFQDRFKKENAKSKASRWQRSQICHLLLSVPQASQYVNLSLCEGLKLETILPGGPVGEALREEDFEEEFEKRVCTSRDFKRQSEIFEKWQIR